MSGMFLIFVVCACSHMVCVTSDEESVLPGGRSLFFKQDVVRDDTLPDCGYTSVSLTTNVHDLANVHHFSYTAQKACLCLQAYRATNALCESLEVKVLKKINWSFEPSCFLSVSYVDVRKKSHTAKIFAQREEDGVYSVFLKSYGHENSLNLVSARCKGLCPTSTFPFYHPSSYASFKPAACFSTDRVGVRFLTCFSIKMLFPFMELPDADWVVVVFSPQNFLDRFSVLTKKREYRCSIAPPDPPFPRLMRQSMHNTSFTWIRDGVAQIIVLSEDAGSISLKLTKGTPKPQSLLLCAQKTSFWTQESFLALSCSYTSGGAARSLNVEVSTNQDRDACVFLFKLFDPSGEKSEVITSTYVLERSALRGTAKTTICCDNSVDDMQVAARIPLPGGDAGIRVESQLKTPHIINVTLVKSGEKSTPVKCVNLSPKADKTPEPPAKKFCHRVQPVVDEDESKTALHGAHSEAACVD